MLILLPPSETKHAPRRGKPLDLASISFPELTGAREQVLDALVELCQGDPEVARTTLDLPPGLAMEVVRNAGLRRAPTTTAGRLYTGVLYDNLSIETLGPAARRRASSRLVVASSLFGLVRLGDRLPAYWLSGDASLPGVGTIASVWRQTSGDVLGPETDRGLVVDLRSGMYAGFWRPTREQARRVVTLRVLHEVAGRRTVVSHFNKATKGRLVRALLEDGRTTRAPARFADLLVDLGWTVEPTPGMKAGAYDVIVDPV